MTIDQSDLGRALAQFRSARMQTIALAEPLSQAQSDFSSGSGSWSAGEILDHLLLTEQIYDSYIARVFELARSGAQPALYISLIELDTTFRFIPRSVIPMFSLPLSVFNALIPAVVRETLVRLPLVAVRNPRVGEPRKGRPIQTLRVELESAVGDTERLFRNNARILSAEMRICHPLLGNNNLPQLLRIAAAHEERHQRQLQSLLSDSRFPASASRKAPAPLPLEVIDSRFEAGPDGQETKPVKRGKHSAAPRPSSSHSRGPERTPTSK